MRKAIFALATIFLLLTVFSCKKNKDSVTIIGTWTTVSESSKTYEGTSTTPIDESSYDPTTDGVETTTFKADGTTTSVAGGDTTTGTYTYDATNKKLTVLQDGFGVGYDVTTLTSNSLIIHGELSETDPNTGTIYKFVLDGSYKR